MNCEKTPTGKPSEDRRWMQYYPEMMLKMRDYEKISVNRILL